MKKNAILVIGFSKYSDELLAKKADFIMVQMGGNALYSDAGTKLTDVADALKGFGQVIGKKGTILNYGQLKKEARKALITTLKVLGEYVRDKYPGNVANWQTSGYSVQQFDTPTQKPEIPLILKTEDGKYSGETLLIAKRPKYTLVFEGRCWEEGTTPSDKLDAVSSSNRILFSGLTPVKRYIFQIRARGTKGTSKWSNPAVYVVN